jgi:hypothetical protein
LAVAFAVAFAVAGRLAPGFERGSSVDGVVVRGCAIVGEG